MTYEFLPRPEPGEPPMKFRPDFADRVLQRFDEYERQQNRRRTVATVLTAVCLLGCVSLLTRRLIDDRQRPGIPQTQADALKPRVKVTPAQRPAALLQTLAHAVKPGVKVTPAQQPTPPKTAVKHGAPGGVPAGHDHPVANANAGSDPEEIALTVDGKAYRCPANVLRPRNAGQFEQVSDGKHVRSPSSLLSRCRPDPTPGSEQSHNPPR